MTARGDRIGRIRQRVARGLDRHGDGILVPVRHGALALALAHDRRIEPSVRRRHRFTLQAQPRQIRTKSSDPDALGHDVPSRFLSFKGEFVGRAQSRIAAFQFRLTDLGGRLNASGSSAAPRCRPRPCPVASGRAPWRHHGPGALPRTGGRPCPCPGPERARWRGSTR